jgi:hypothetical protein
MKMSFFTMFFFQLSFLGNLQLGFTSPYEHWHNFPLKVKGNHRVHCDDSCHAELVVSGNDKHTEPVENGLPWSDKEHTVQAENYDKTVEEKLVLVDGLSPGLGRAESQLHHVELEVNDHPQLGLLPAVDVVVVIVLGDLQGEVKVLLLDVEISEALENSLDHYLAKDAQQDVVAHQVARWDVFRQGFAGSCVAHEDVQGKEGDHVYVEVSPITKVATNEVQEDDTNEVDEGVEGHEFEHLERGHKCASTFSQKGIY